MESMVARSIRTGSDWLCCIGRYFLVIANAHSVVEIAVLVAVLTALYPVSRLLDQALGTPYWFLVAMAVFFLAIVPAAGYTADYFRRRGGA